MIQNIPNFISEYEKVTTEEDRIKVLQKYSDLKIIFSLAYTSAVSLRDPISVWRLRHKFTPSYEIKTETQFLIFLTQFISDKLAVEEAAGLIGSAEKTFGDYVYKIICGNIVEKLNTGILHKAYDDFFKIKDFFIDTPLKERSSLNLTEARYVVTPYFEGVQVALVICPIGSVLISDDMRMITSLNRIFNDLRGNYHTPCVLIGNIAIDNCSTVNEMREAIFTKKDIRDFKFYVYDCMALHPHQRSENLTYLDRINLYCDCVRSSREKTFLPGCHFIRNQKELLDRMERYAKSSYENALVIEDSVHFSKRNASSYFRIEPVDQIDVEVVSTKNDKAGSTSFMKYAFINYEGTMIPVENGFNTTQRVRFASKPEEIIGKIIRISHGGITTSESGKVSIINPRFCKTHE